MLPARSHSNRIPPRSVNMASICLGFVRILHTSVTSSDKLPVSPLHMSRIMKRESRNSSTHSGTPPPTHILRPSRKSAAGNAFSTTASTQSSPSPQEVVARAPLFLTPPGYSDFARRDPPAPLLLPSTSAPLQTKHILEDPPERPLGAQNVSRDASPLSSESSSPLQDSRSSSFDMFKVRPVFGGDWPSSLTSTAAASDAANSNFPLARNKFREAVGGEGELKFRDCGSRDSVPSSSAASLPLGEFRRTNQSLADFWEERVGYKRSFSDGDRPAPCSSFRPFNPTYYYYHPESSRKGRSCLMVAFAFTLILL